jgi:hypothetical protein
VSSRFRPTDAFVDESIRGQRYLMGCVLIEAKDLPAVRREADSLVLTGGRVHFHNESARRRRDLLVAFAAMPVSAFVVVCQRGHGITEFKARDRCLTAIIERIQTDAVSRLVIESRRDDRDDHRTIHRARAVLPSLVFEHRSARDEPLLWIADGVTWAAGAGAAWRAMLGTILSPIVELRP